MLSLNLEILADRWVYGLSFGFEVFIVSLIESGIPFLKEKISKEMKTLSIECDFLTIGTEPLGCFLDGNLNKIRLIFLKKGWFLNHFFVFQL